jgi:isoquinoline 1-oxidoreductase subunit alpha
MMHLNVNGQQQSFDGDPSMPLLWYLRDELGLVGTKFGCGIAECGACTVHVDGQAVRACITPMSGVQKAWMASNVPQCGYCQAGQIMQAAALLDANKNPSEAQIFDAMAGNICRCGCYQRITAAVKAAATGA